MKQMKKLVNFISDKWKSFLIYLKNRKLKNNNKLAYDVFNKKKISFSRVKGLMTSMQQSGVSLEEHEVALKKDLIASARAYNEARKNLSYDPTMVEIHNEKVEMLPDDTSIHHLMDEDADESINTLKDQTDKLNGVNMFKRIFRENKRIRL